MWFGGKKSYGYFSPSKITIIFNIFLLPEIHCHQRKHTPNIMLENVWSLGWGDTCLRWWNCKECKKEKRNEPKAEWQRFDKVLKKISTLSTSRGLPWGFSGEESACQCRRHGFDPWSRKIPHATKPSCHYHWPCTLGSGIYNYRVHEPQWLKPVHPRPRLCSKRSHHIEKPSPPN